MEPSVSQVYCNGPRQGLELFLDTKGACFLCLNENTCEMKNNEMTEVCLRNVCRYLNINPCSILLKCLRESLSNDEGEKKGDSYQKEKCDFSVLLCGTCASLVNSLSKLIREVEVSKMLMKNQLQEFHKILTTSAQEIEHSTGQSTRFKLSDCGSNPMETRIVAQLRKDTKEKCSAKVKKMLSRSLPKVGLSRLKNATQTEDMEMSIASVPEKKSINELECSTPISSDHQPIPILNAGVPLAICSIETPERFLEPQSVEPFMSYNLNYKDIVQDHSENCKDIKPEDLVLDEVIILEDTKAASTLVSPQHISSTTPMHLSTAFQYPGHQQEDTVPQEPFLDCQQNSVISECSTTYNVCFRSKVLAKYCESFDAQQNTFQCAICNYFIEGGNKFSALDHILNIHPDSFFAPNKMTCLSNEAFEFCCRQVLNSLVENSKPQNMLTKEASNKHQSFPEEQKYFCAVCSWQCHNNSNLACHWIHEHKDVLDDMVLRYQQDWLVSTGNFTQRYDQVNLNYRDDYVNSGDRAHMEQLGVLNTTECSSVNNVDNEDDDIIVLSAPPVNPNGNKTQSLNLRRDGSSETSISPHPSTSTQNLTADLNLLNDTHDIWPASNSGCTNKCPICDKFPKESYYIKHLVNNHIGAVFASAKLPETSEATFKKYCENVLMAEARKAERQIMTRRALSVGQQILLCLHCKIPCHIGKDLKYHLVSEHGNVIKEKVIRLQRDNLFLNQIMKQQTKRRYNWTCKYSDANGKCGQRFSSAYKMLMHQRSRCNKRFSNAESSLLAKQRTVIQNTGRLNDTFTGSSQQPHINDVSISHLGQTEDYDKSSPPTATISLEYSDGPVSIVRTQIIDKHKGQLPIAKIMENLHCAMESFEQNSMLQPKL